MMRAPDARSDELDRQGRFASGTWQRRSAPRQSAAAADVIRRARRSMFTMKLAQFPIPITI
eukprot:5258663-Pleurochrysis_carterae.AAC.2